MFCVVTPMAKLRTIIKEARFEQELAKIQPDVERADDFIEGVEQVLARNPQAGERLSDSHVYFISGHTVDLALFYTFDDNHVFFLSIQKTFPPEL